MGVHGPSDKRWGYTRKYLTLRQDPANPVPQKLGLFNPRTWGAYLLNGELFLKQYRPDPSRTYPDFGCSFETFTNAEFLEIETLGPMTKIPPSQFVTHVENWSLHKGVNISQFTDDELDRVLSPLLSRRVHWWFSGKMTQMKSLAWWDRFLACCAAIAIAAPFAAGQTPSPALLRA